MKTKQRQSSTALIPLPTSAATSVRCSGVGSSPADQRAAHPHPDRRRARLEEAAADRPPLHRRVVPDLLPGGEELGRPPSAGPGGGAGVVIDVDRAPRAHRSGSARRRAAHQLLPLAAISDASTICTLPPRPQHLGLHLHRPDRHRPQDLKTPPAPPETPRPRAPPRSPARAEPKAAPHAGTPGPRAPGSTQWRRTRRRSSRRTPQPRAPILRSVTSDRLGDQARNAPRRHRLVRHGVSLDESERSEMTTKSPEVRRRSGASS